MGTVLGLSLGTVSAQTQSATPTATADSTARSGSATPVAKAGGTGELTVEQKNFEQSLKAIRAQSHQRDVKFVQAVRKREKARREKVNAGKTGRVGPSEPAMGPAVKTSETSSSGADSVLNGD